jgi:hypothetical protein
VGGTSSTPAPADYGFTATANGRAAIRDWVLDARSDAPINMTGGTFYAEFFLLSDSGAFDWRFTGGPVGSGRETMPLALSSASNASLVTVGSLETLTIPINARFFMETFDADDTALTATGQLVATRIPEPASAGLLAAAGLLLAARRRRCGPRQPRL